MHNIRREQTMRAREAPDLSQPAAALFKLALSELTLLLSSDTRFGQLPFKRIDGQFDPPPGRRRRPPLRWRRRNSVNGEQLCIKVDSNAHKVSATQIRSQPVNQREPSWRWPSSRPNTINYHFAWQFQQKRSHKHQASGDIADASISELYRSTAVATRQAIGGRWRQLDASQCAMIAANDSRMGLCHFLDTIDL